MLFKSIIDKEEVYPALSFFLVNFEDQMTVSGLFYSPLTFPHRRGNTDKFEYAKKTLRIVSTYSTDNMHENPIDEKFEYGIYKN